VGAVRLLPPRRRLGRRRAGGRRGPGARRRAAPAPDNVYRGAPGDHPIDRAFALVAERYAIPEGLPGELLLGMEMDAHEMQYETFAELDLYCYRVASVVGLMMTCVMRSGSMAPDAWLRAADLGLAMQLTNIARDVGEDARRGRVYLPLELLERHGVDGAALLAKPQMSPGLGAAIQELLARAEAHYQSAERGIAMLPPSCRPAIYASRLIYGAIGGQVGKIGYDSITQRAFVSTGKKLWLALRSLGGLWLVGEGDGPGPSDAMLTPRLRAAGILA